MMGGFIEREASSPQNCPTFEKLARASHTHILGCSHCRAALQAAERANSLREAALALRGNCAAGRELLAAVNTHMSDCARCVVAHTENGIILKELEPDA